MPPAARGPQVVTPAEPPSASAATAAEEKAWERTHLEQVMFRLAREHAEAAGRCAASAPPDRDGERTHSLVSVLMAYFAVEAFINMVGQDRLGGRFRHYDRMTPEGKWLEVTRLVSKSGRTFSDEGRELSALSTLRSWRNMLTHYKGRYEDTQSGARGETQVDALLSADNAKRAVETATMLYRTFYELDRRSAPRQFRWLDDRVPGSVTASGRKTAPAAAPSKAGGGPPRRAGKRRATRPVQTVPAPEAASQLPGAVPPIEVLEQTARQEPHQPPHDAPPAPALLAPPPTAPAKRRRRRRGGRGRRPAAPR